MHEDVSATAPLNSQAEFREELAKLKATETTMMEETQNENAESRMDEGAPEKEGEVREEEGSGTEDLPDSTNDGVYDDDLVDSRAPVPVKRLKKEIEKRHALEAQLQKEREEKIRYQTEIETYNKAMASFNNASQGLQPKVEQLDPLDEDAHRYYMEQQTKQDEKFKSMEAEINAMKMKNTMEQQEAAFTRQTPDFREAYKHLVDSELKANRYVAQNEEEAQLMTAYKLRGMAENAMNKGANVAEIFYNIAKSYGYVSKAEKATPNLNAIENNMRKSKVADVPTTPLQPSNGAGNYTNMGNFDRMYSGSAEERKDKFYQALKAIRENR